MKYPFIKKLIFHIFQTKGKHSLSCIKRNSRDAMKVNSDLLMTILKHNKNTEYGKKYHFSRIKTIEEYRKIVPLSEYEVYMPYINQMVKGKKI